METRGSRLEGSRTGQACQGSCCHGSVSKNAWKAKASFVKAGFKDAEPGKNILTYNKWIEQGYRVKKGEHSNNINGLRLFHSSQVEPMNAKDKAAALAALKEKVAKRQAKVVPIHA